MILPPEKNPPSAMRFSLGLRLAVVAGVVVVCLLVVILFFQNTELPPPPEDPTAAMLASVKPDRLAAEAITPLPKQLYFEPRKAALGRKLFSDKRLSRDNTVSCATCHILERGGTDGISRSIGIGGAQGVRNAPTVLNSGFNFRQFWDGRALTLEEQIDGPLTNPKEMGSSWKQVLTKLAADPAYVSRFAEIYPSVGLSPATVRDAIATFERALVTVDAPFDRWLRGDKSAISVQALAGYVLFKNYGCISCHHGANVGGNMFERVGLIHDYFADYKKNRDSDLGRFVQTGNEEDQYEFKVPTLRNIALTAPYFHDGSVKTLREAIDMMAYYQLGLKLPQKEIDSIEAFLRTLTGLTPEALR